jgi:hypothetical protein
LAASSFDLLRMVGVIDHGSSMGHGRLSVGSTASGGRASEHRQQKRGLR